MTPCGRESKPFSRAQSMSQRVGDLLPQVVGKVSIGLLIGEPVVLNSIPSKPPLLPKIGENVDRGGRRQNVDQ